MRKEEFLEALQRELSGLPRDGVEERLAFYAEMIDDRVEEGCTEEEAVGDIGPAEAIAAQILAETPLVTIAKERLKRNRRLRPWETVLLVLGSPLWFSLAMAAFGVILSLYAALWAVVAALWACFVAFTASAVCCGIGGVALAFLGIGLEGMLILGTGLICAGFAILLFFGCLGATKGAARLARVIVISVKRCFVKKEGK